MLIKNIIDSLENFAPPAYQEHYDNAGLITGNPDWDCTGIICGLDATEVVVGEAIEKGCNLLVVHHPIIFSAIKKIIPKTYVERTIIKAIKHDIAIYAIHTNLDNIAGGVNTTIAQRLGMRMESLSILQPKADVLTKLYTYVPVEQLEQVKAALFAVGAGTIGLYEECSFSSPGTGTFKPLPGSHPVIGKAGGLQESVNEARLEVILPNHLQHAVVAALHRSHPYEVPAYELVRVANQNQQVGSGILGELSHTMNELEFLSHLKTCFGLSVIKHTRMLGKPIRTVALCGGAGSFLVKKAIAAGADAYITGDMKYHEFFDVDGHFLLADIGHWESEQFTTDLLAIFLQDKFPTFAVLKTGVQTNPVYYFV